MAKPSQKPSQVRLEKPAHGKGKLRRGNPGKWGGGRPPDEFKRNLAALVSSEKTSEFLKACLEGAHGPMAALKAIEFAAERGYGRVPNVTKIEGGDEPLTIRIVQE